jgi:hypothetical protein
LYYNNTLGARTIFVLHQLFMAAKAGRPRVDKAKARSPGISVRLTSDERKPIDSAIKTSGLTQSDWARKALLHVALNDIRIT